MTNVRERGDGSDSFHDQQVALSKHLLLRQHQERPLVRYCTGSAPGPYKSVVSMATACHYPGQFVPRASQLTSFLSGPGTANGAAIARLREQYAQPFTIKEPGKPTDQTKVSPASSTVHPVPFTPKFPSDGTPHSAVHTNAFSSPPVNRTECRRSQHVAPSVAAGRTTLTYRPHRHDVSLLVGASSPDTRPLQYRIKAADLKSAGSGGAATSSVRNMNYTPAKPYYEVAALSPGHAASMSKLPETATRIQMSETRGESTIRNRDSGTRMPVTNTVTGTLFYRKLSKAEEVIHNQQRQTADGSELARSLTNSSNAVHKPPDEKASSSATSTSTKTKDDLSSTAEADSCTAMPPDGERLPGDGEDFDEWVDGNDDDDDDDCSDDNEDGMDEMDNESVDASDGDCETIIKWIQTASAPTVVGTHSTFEKKSLVLRRGSDDHSSSSDPQPPTSDLRIRSATRRLLGLTLRSSSTTSTVSSVPSIAPTQKNKQVAPAAIAAQPPVARPRPTTATRQRALSEASTNELEPALMPSLYPHVPPTINFIGESQKVELLPWEIRKMLKWRLSPITPNVVRYCINRSHFRITKKNHDWIGYFGKHMKAQGFKVIREYQKVNHFPGSFQMGRKDRLWRNLSRLQLQFGRREFGFFPQTFVLPMDLKMLRRAWEDGGSRLKWIIKPPASARGIGIRVVHKWTQIPKKRPIIVQRYLSKPYLINESKFDLRLYVYVTNYDPLRVYLYDDGLVRFASCKYSSSVKSLSNRYMHLTNYSINKRNTEYETNANEHACQGHKWSLKALWGYMRKNGINTNAVWENIKDLIIKTIISCESCVNSLMKCNVRRRYSCHELFGFDVMLDESFKPWLIEVNISPSLHSNSPLDVNIKGGMVKDMLNLAGFMLPDKIDVVPSSLNIAASSTNTTAPATATTAAPPPTRSSSMPKGICIDKRLWPSTTSTDERAKHAYYCQRHNDEAVQQMILEVLTPDDLRILVESTDEDSRRGNFQRIFPSVTTHKYLAYFESPRYYNLLLDCWVRRYHRMEARGIVWLESLCRKKLHLQNPTTEPKHQWSPPSNIAMKDSARLITSSGISLGKTPPGVTKVDSVTLL